MPAFWILDVCTPDGRDSLFGIATTTRASWWSNDFGRMYSGRGDTWGMEEMSGDAPVSLTFRHANGEVPRAWFLLGARGTLQRLGAEADQVQLPVTGPLRRVRCFGEELFAVGAGGQVLRGRDLELAPSDGLLAEERYLLDLAGTSARDLCVVGRRGEAFHFDGEHWKDWSVGGGDLLAVARYASTYVLGGEGGRVLHRDGECWALVDVPTEEPIVGLVEHEGALWAATPSAVFRGDLRRLEPVANPGFGGQLTAGDGVLYCAGVAHLARWTNGAWQRIPHPDQTEGPAVPWPSLGAALDASREAVVDPAAALGGALFTDETIDEQALARWAALSVAPARARKMLSDSGAYRVLEIQGDLHVAGDLSTFAAKLVGLIVHGDLTVEGTFSDCDDPQTLTLVGGALRARTIFTSGQLEVGGAVSCEHLLGDYNDFSAELRGPVSARLFVPEHHHFQLGGPLRIGMSIGAPGLEDASPRRLAAVLRREVLRGTGTDTEFDRKAALVALRAGQSLWRGNPPRLTPANKGEAKPRPARRKPSAG